MLLVVLFVALALFTEPGLGKMTADPMTVLFEEFWDWRLTRSPEFGSMTGDKAHNTDLETFTEQRFAEDEVSCRAFLARAQELLADTTEPRDRLQIRFFMAEIGTFISGYPFKGFHFPMNFMEGIQVDFQRLANDFISLETVEDYEHVITRYEKFGKLAAQITIMMETAIVLNRTNHASSMNGVVDQCRDHLKPAAETVFFIPFLTASNISEGELARLQTRALAAIETSVQPGFKLLADFLTEKYLPKTRPDIAASSVSSEYYEACLAFHTSTNLTAQEIHQKGLDEVARIEEEMKEIIREMGYNLTLPEFIEMLRNDEANFFNSPQELLDTFKDIIENRIEPMLLTIFNKKPAAELEIVEVPASTPDAPAAYYNAGSLDGKRPGRLYVNTHKYKSQPRYEMVSLSLHETNPGHHLQGSFMLEQDWPLFRKIMEDRAYSQAPSRFPINTAYVEGWGLYSETLGFDMGLYTDPLDRYGHLSEEIFRACRLVVDTGMHALGWTRDQAVQFMADHTAASLENIRSEVDRYIAWPGQATGYKIGQMKIRELRTRAENMLGAKFNIKDFHQIVLNSFGPLHILEEEIDNWISGQGFVAGAAIVGQLKLPLQGADQAMSGQM